MSAQMTDRELLEMAAKANGYQVKGWAGEHLVFFNPITESAEERWDPLIDDGDALRLAIALRIGVDFGASKVYIHQEPYIVEQLHVDSESVVRRAIVRRAAEIGRAMP